MARGPMPREKKPPVRATVKPKPSGSTAKPRAHITPIRSKKSTAYSGALAKVKKAGKGMKAKKS